MASLVAVRRWAAPVLDEEQRQPFGRAGKILLGVDAAQDGVGGHAGVKALDEEAKGGLTSGEIEEAGVKSHVTLPVGSRTLPPRQESQIGRASCRERV